MTLDVAPVHLLAAIGALLTVALLARGSARRARRAAVTARAGVRVVSLAGRVVIAAGLLVGVQWVLITQPIGNPTLLLVLLGLPDLLAAHVLIRALTVTAVEPQPRGGGRR